MMEQNINRLGGLPGYGLQGTDGSSGLNGVAIYYSSYAGKNDDYIITNKIKLNNELFNSDEHIPGYPERLYQTGDVFIDKVANVFKVDLSINELYTYTNNKITSSNFFKQKNNQELSPGYIRYTNNNLGENKLIIDSVYTEKNDINYTEYPILGIYKTSPSYYSNINFIDVSIINKNNIGSYFPFQLWGTGIDSNDDCLALTREYNENVWHLGNKQHDEIRNIDLSLDFINVNMKGDVSIHTGMEISGDLNANGNLTITADEVFLPGKTGIEDPFQLTGDLNISGNVSMESLHDSNNLFILEDLNINNSIEVDGDASINGYLNLNDNINLSNDIVLKNGTISVIANHIEFDGGVTMVDGEDFGNITVNEMILGGAVDVYNDSSFGGSVKLRGELNLNNLNLDKDAVHFNGNVKIETDSIARIGAAPDASIIAPPWEYGVALWANGGLKIVGDTSILKMEATDDSSATGDVTVAGEIKELYSIDEPGGVRVIVETTTVRIQEEFSIYYPFVGYISISGSSEASYIYIWQDNAWRNWISTTPATYQKFGMVFAPGRYALNVGPPVSGTAAGHIVCTGMYGRSTAPENGENSPFVE